MKIIRPYFGILISGILLFFLIKPFVHAHTHLREVSFQVQWHWIIPSFAFLMFYRSLYTYPLSVLLSGTMQKHVPFHNAFMLFHLANITRYLPGRIWGVVRMFSLSNQFGLSKTAVGGSLTLHIGVETALGGLVGLSLLFSKQTRDTAQSILNKASAVPIVFFVLIGVGIIVGMLSLVPILLPHVRRFLRALFDTGKSLFKKSFWTQWINIIAVHVLLWTCQGLAFYLFVRGLVPVSFSHVTALTACYAFAWICGFLSFLTPGGLGIREGLLALLLAIYIPGHKATLVALLCRAWMLSAEIVLAGVAFFLERKILKANDRYGG